MLTKLFSHLLTSFSFPEPDKVLYSLSFCQGDGVSFEVSIGSSDFQALFPCLLDHMEKNNMVDRFRHRKNLNRFYELMKSGHIDDLQITQSGRYVHEYSMSIDSRHLELPEESEDGYISEELCREIQDLVLDYARYCARRCDEIGCSVLLSLPHESKVQRIFNRDQYCVVVKHNPVDLDYLDEYCEFDDPSDVYELARSIIDNEVEVFDLSVEIQSAESNETLAEHGTIMVCKVGDPHYRMTLKDCLREARFSMPQKVGKLMAA